jgi:TonB family protein
MNNGNMKQPCMLLAFFGLWLAAPMSAQTGATAPDHVSLEIVQTELPRFPLMLSSSSVMNGDATVAIHVDQDGQLTDYLVTGYSRKEFADSAVDALKVWRFNPSRLNGVSWPSVQEVHFDFSRTGVVVSATAFDFLMNRIDEIDKDKFAYHSRTLRELDRIPTPVHVVSPVSPNLTGGENRRTVAVDFYIDEEGRVRMPSVSRADVGTACAASAVDAVKQWRFEPPLYRGQPALVFVRQEFHFVIKQ